MHYFSPLFYFILTASKVGTDPTSLADTQHNEYDKHQLQWKHY